MWDVCFGNRKKILSDQGSGCILAHDMGLGKSVQIIALLHTLKRLDNIPITKILILSPKSLVQNWEDEVNKWTKGLQVRLKVFSWSTDKNIAVQHLHEWSGLGGIYVLGYEMFVSVCKRFRSSDGEQSVDLSTFFLSPGPDVIVCDEAHLLKNSASEKYKMVSQVKTKRRIALTGTPIQNNLKELYNIVNFVQPTFMKPEKFRDQFIEPISLAQQSGASPYQKRKATERITVLHKELEKVMDREQGSNQEVGLPPKLNYDVFLYLTPIQKKLYKFFFDKLTDCTQDHKRNFEMERKAEMIGIHPKSLELGYNKTRSRKKAEQKYEWPVELQGDWWDKVLARDEKQVLNEIDAGVKIDIAFQIINLAARNKEKVLIFCNSHEVLNLMQFYLEKKGYKKNVNYFRLDCSVSLVNRRKYLKTFNNDDNTEAQVFLLTHKVGGVGLNFTGANRIVIFDMLWNPAHHEQSSNRTHRLGQKKTSFVYRLITKDSLEENIYKNSVSKQSLSKRVVDKKRIKSQCRETGVYNFTYRETPKPKNKQPDAKDDLLNEIIHNSGLNIVHSYREQGELFELSEEQLNEAQAYEEYLVESKTFELPAGETKWKRKRKSKPDNQLQVPDRMMSRELIGNYEHGQLLERMNQITPPAKPIPVQQVPMNLSQTASAAGRIPPPPPLVRIPRGGQHINQNLNRQQQRKKETVPLQTFNQTHQPNNNQEHQPPQSINQTDEPSSIHGYDKSLFSSITDFIKFQAGRCDPNISGIASALAKNAVEIIPRRSTSRTRIIDETCSRVNQDTSGPNEPQQHPAPLQKRRLSINPDIFQHPPPVDNEDQEQIPTNQNQVTTGQNQTTSARTQLVNTTAAHSSANLGQRRASTGNPSMTSDGRAEGETDGNAAPTQTGIRLQMRRYLTESGGHYSAASRSTSGGDTRLTSASGNFMATPGISTPVNGPRNPTPNLSEGNTLGRHSAIGNVISGGNPTQSSRTVAGGNPTQSSRTVAGGNSSDSQRNHFTQELQPDMRLISALNDDIIGTINSGTIDALLNTKLIPLYSNYCLNKWIQYMMSDEATSL
uniref:Protein CHROMATIN REMODELING 20 n=1 Tax=Cacopsylla melanoneura TaxID=428564 RepID=A0A8D8V7S3_9HEMI